MGEGFYQIYFQKQGVADAEPAKDIPASLRRVLAGASGGNPPDCPQEDAELSACAGAKGHRLTGRALVSGLPQHLGAESATPLS
ncbi:hypothetical protein [Streptomyces sp. FXY-T5]|uniref:hypothetical protein n=1 Tax=Streptomyces sp. FXY-T5 TaxID=3064901 RepID=UPI0027D1EFF4|nr:hypothetical protein [Streptomyces sp. FXY-T5]WMD06759.1 hypothetical protein Q7C01_21240 [Streptomyces sp. FXY-T5]